MIRVGVSTELRFLPSRGITGGMSSTINLKLNAGCLMATHDSIAMPLHFLATRPSESEVSVCPVFEGFRVRRAERVRIEAQPRANRTQYTRVSLNAYKAHNTSTEINRIEAQPRWPGMCFQRISKRRPLRHCFLERTKIKLLDLREPYGRGGAESNRYRRRVPFETASL